MTGLHLSQYRIDDELGRGGMGIVYKATDTKLNRTVALKVLPASALASDDDRARFFREAQAAAQLHHPNIATVFQIDEAVPVDENGERVTGQDEKRLFIAMEFVEGDTLADYIKKGPVKLHEAVGIAGQVAEALKEAHAKEIVHRDIKSANVMLTGQGVAKVLDFGLAKTNASTMLTRMGSTLGTVAYMSPEQARGQEVDGRTDLYSLGTMLYEMVAGKLPYAGDYEQAVLYAILNEPPEPLTAVRTGVPMDLERVVGKLLSKEAEYRYQTAADLLADLKALDLTGSGVSRRSMSAVQSPAAAPAAAGSSIPRWVYGAMAVLLLAGLALGSLLNRGESETLPTTRFSVRLEAASEPLDASWSADGRTLYYLAVDSVNTRAVIRAYDLQSGLSREVDGTAFARSVHASPDGRWLVFGNSRTNTLDRVVVTGGQASAIPNSHVDDMPVGAMAMDGTTYFPYDDWDLGMLRADGTFETVIMNDSLGSVFMSNPEISPDGESVYWTAWTGLTNSDGTWARLSPGATAVHVLPEYRVEKIASNGYAIVASAGAVDNPAMVVPFDASTGTFEGVPVAFATTGPIALSAGGSMAYQELRSADQQAAGEPLFGFDDDGDIEQIVTTPGVSNEFAGANNRNAIVVESRPIGESLRDLYLLDRNTGTETRLTRDGTNNNAYWSGDDQYVYFDRLVGGGPSVIARRRVDGTGSIETILSDSVMLAMPAVTPAGDVLVYSRLSADTGWDLYGVSLPDGEPFVVSDAEERQDQPHFSPDGRYVAFRSGDADMSVIVQPLEGEGGVELASDGQSPVWSTDGHIYYRNSGGNELLRIAVTTDPVFAKVGNPESLYRTREHLHVGIDYQGRPLISKPSAQSVRWGDVWIVLNFHDEMERMAPRAR